MSTQIKHMRTDWFAALNGDLASVRARVLAVLGL